MQLNHPACLVQVGFNKDGSIQGLDLDIYNNAGCSLVRALLMCHSDKHPRHRALPDCKRASSHHAHRRWRLLSMHTSRWHTAACH